MLGGWLHGTVLSAEVALIFQTLKLNCEHRILMTNKIHATVLEAEMREVHV